MVSAATWRDIREDTHRLRASSSSTKTSLDLVRTRLSSVGCRPTTRSSSSVMVATFTPGGTILDTASVQRW